VEDELERAAEFVLRDDDPWNLDYWQQHRERLLDDLGLIAAFPGRILEVGSAPYFNTLALHRLGREIVGVDIDPSRAPIGIQVRPCDIERMPLPAADGEFDIVVFSEVFEHLRIDPMFTVSELRRVLQPDGTLLLTTPNLRSLRGVLRLVLLGKGWAVGAWPAREYGQLRELGWMGHVREYTAREVTGVLDQCGFAVQSVVWRRKPGTWWQRLLEHILPPLRPYMTLIAKPHARPDRV